MRLARLLALPLLLIGGTAAHASTHWAVDRVKSRLGFSVMWSGEPFVATFRSWTADIDFDPDDLSHARIVATIDLASEGSDTPDNDDGLKGPQGFWIDRFRYARFESNSVEAQGRGAFIANGTLSLHGLSKKVALPFHLTITGNTAQAKGSIDLSRTEFGLGTGEWAGETPIAHKVSVTFDLLAQRAQ